MRSTFNGCVGCTGAGLPCAQCGRDRDYHVYACDKCGHEIDPDTEGLYVCDDVDYCKECFRDMLVDRINEEAEMSELAALLNLDYTEEVCR